MTEELVIDDDNFAEYFKDVRTSKPDKGDVLACFRASAELVEGNEKKNLMDLLMNTEKAVAATQVMRKLFNATEQEANRVCRELCEDLLEVGYNQTLAKPHKYTLELFYYTKKEHVPVDDPHWSVISLLNVDKLVSSVQGQEDGPKSDSS
jgi:hypothetical protein